MDFLQCKEKFFLPNESFLNYISWNLHYILNERISFSFIKKKFSFFWPSFRKHNILDASRALFWRVLIGDLLYTRKITSTPIKAKHCSNLVSTKMWWYFCGNLPISCCHHWKWLWLRHLASEQVMGDVPKWVR